MEIDEIIERLEKITKSIDEAFERGTIDLDQISAELEAISSELQTKLTGSNPEMPTRHLLKSKEENKELIYTADFR